MDKRIKPFSVGYFTDETAQTLLRNLSGGHPCPAAVHIEAQNMRWGLIAEQTAQGQNPPLSHHGEFCTRILSGALSTEKSSAWDAGFIDEHIFTKHRAAFMAAALHPNIRTITISSQEKRLQKYNYRHYLDLSGPVVLKSVGNNGYDWAEYQRTATLSGEVYMPGFLRVGEALPTGAVDPGSQVSGPAFICDHPRNVRDVMGDKLYFPTQDDVRTFLDWPYHGIPDDYAAILSGYKQPEKDLHEFYGTSASSPHAGAMVMRHTADMVGIASYDIIPAILMAAQVNGPPPEALKKVGTQSGMIFDPFHYGHGVLVEPCLSEMLKDIWEVRSKSGKVTVSGAYSNSGVTEGYGTMSAKTEGAQGPVVNTVLRLSFANDEKSPDVAESRIPLFVFLRSPQGTVIHLPILYERQSAYGPYICAGYQTSAFFGEDISKGKWQVACSKTDENTLRIASVKIIAHTMHEKSPGNILFRGFQKALLNGPSC